VESIAGACVVLRAQVHGRSAGNRAGLRFCGPGPHSFGVRPEVIINYFTPPPPDRDAKYCDQLVCMSVCVFVCLLVYVSVRSHISKATSEFKGQNNFLFTLPLDQSHVG